MPELVKRTPNCSSFLDAKNVLGVDVGVNLKVVVCRDLQGTEDWHLSVQVGILRETRPWLNKIC